MEEDLCADNDARYRHWERWGKPTVRSAKIHDIYGKSTSYILKAFDLISKSARRYPTRNRLVAECKDFIEGRLQVS